MLTPELSNDSLRFLKKRDPKQFRQIFQAIVSLCETPRPTDSIAMGDGIHFRQSVGEFRVIYKFDSEKLFVSTIGHRNDGAAYALFTQRD
ncbi:MAG TPA: hypothetical protein V6C76_10605 [Drouetiella sp.]